MLKIKLGDVLGVDQPAGHMLDEKVTERQSIGVKLCLSRILYAYRGDLSGLAMDPPVSTPAGFIRLQEFPRPLEYCFQIGGAEFTGPGRRNSRRMLKTN